MSRCGTNVIALDPPPISFGNVPFFGSQSHVRGSLTTEALRNTEPERSAGRAFPARGPWRSTADDAVTMCSLAVKREGREQADFKFVEAAADDAASTVN